MLKVKNREILVAPSLMCMDILNVEKQIMFLNKYVDIYHIDIMDGHYVDNLAFSMEFAKAIKVISTVDVDCHLMVSDPSKYINTLLSYDIDYISIHAEKLNGIAFRTFEKIINKGKKVGVVLNPETSIEIVFPYIKYIDKITLMSVDPGFAGQTFIEEVLDKVKDLKELKRVRGYTFKIEIDGSVNKKNFKKIFDSGIEVFIVGASGLFDLAEDIECSWKEMLEYFYE